MSSFEDNKHPSEGSIYAHCKEVFAALDIIACDGNRYHLKRHLRKYSYEKNHTRAYAKELIAILDLFL